MNKQDRAKVSALKARILTDTAFAVRVYRAIWDRQKPEEKRTGRHQGHDGKGFREHETVYLNALYAQLVKQEWRITPEQADEIRDAMEPYAEQFLRAQAEKADAKQKAREEAERRGVGFSESYDAARSGEPTTSRIRKLTDEDKRAIEAALERMA